MSSISKCHVFCIKVWCLWNQSIMFFISKYYVFYIKVCLLYQSVMSFISKWYVFYVKVLCVIYQCIMSYISKCHVLCIKVWCIKVSCLMYQSVMFLRSKYNVFYIKVSCVIYQSVSGLLNLWLIVNCWMSHVSHINVSCHTCEWVVGQICTSHFTNEDTCLISHTDKCSCEFKALGSYLALSRLLLRHLLHSRNIFLQRTAFLSYCTTHWSSKW